MIELHQLGALVAPVVSRVSEYQLSRFRATPPGSGREKVMKEYVSEVDVTSEKMLREGLGAIVPEAGFYGEETERDDIGDLMWAVDPLDGTTNYLSGFEEWSVSVALIGNRKPVFGYIEKPYTREVFFGYRGGGAKYRDIAGVEHVLGTAEPMGIEDALIGTGFPYRTPESRGQFNTCVGMVLDAARGIRRTGSAALDLSRVAAGFIQGFWEVDLEAYDIGGALLLLEETDCPYTEFDGSAYRLFQSKSIVAGRPGVAESLRKITTEAYRGRGQA